MPTPNFNITDFDFERFNEMKRSNQTNELIYS